MHYLARLGSVGSGLEARMKVWSLAGLSRAPSQGLLKAAELSPKLSESQMLLFLQVSSHRWRVNDPESRPHRLHILSIFWGCLPSIGWRAKLPQTRHFSRERMRKDGFQVFLFFPSNQSTDSFVASWIHTWEFNQPPPKVTLITNRCFSFYPDEWLVGCYRWWIYVYIHIYIFIYTCVCLYKYVSTSYLPYKHT